MSSFEQTIIGLSPQCYIPIFMTIRLLVLEKKIFDGFLTYMEMAAILFMGPGPRIQTFVPLSHGFSIWNFTSIALVVSEEKMFENVDRLQTTYYRRQTTTTEASHTISSPVSIRLRWAKKQSQPRDVTGSRSESDDSSQLAQKLSQSYA